MTPAADMTPPSFCDLDWRSAGPSRFIATKTALYAEAVACAGHNMEALGFNLRSPVVELDLSGCRDLAALARRLEVWTGVGRRQLFHKREREAAANPPSREAVAALQAGLTQMMSTASSLNVTGTTETPFATAISATS